MASIGHIAVGMAAARMAPIGVSRRSRLIAGTLWSLLSLLPDADVIGLSLGIAYESQWGHRGATHSLAFSFAMAAAIAAIAPRFGLPARRTGILAALVFASHALLDTLTDGGLGCALLWPFDPTRYFAPWNPIPVAPIGFEFFSPLGLIIAMKELVLFAPLFWLGWPSPAAARGSRTWAVMVGVWAVLAWLMTSRDPLRERFVGVILREDTEFAAGFSEAAFREVSQGQLERDVRKRLGSPFYEHLFLWPVRNDCSSITLVGEVVETAHTAEGCKSLGIDRATQRAVVEHIMGPPEEKCWAYSRSRDGGFYRARAVCFANERVIAIRRRWLKD